MGKNSGDESIPIEMAPKWIQVEKGILKGINLFIGNSWKEMISGNYDNFIFDVLKEEKIDLEKAVVWDVGAHIGYHSLAFSILAGSKGKVLAFEPNPYNCKRLLLNLNANPDLSNTIEVHEFALSDSIGKHQFNMHKNVDNSKSSGSYLDYGSLPSDRYSPVIFNDFVHVNVDVFTTDYLISSKNFNTPNLIKLDIEGVEVRFLNGATSVIKNGRPIFIIEVHNIQNMFMISEIFYRNNYQLKLLDDPQKSSSRCFIIAKPQ